MVNTYHYITLIRYAASRTPSPYEGFGDSETFGKINKIVIRYTSQPKTKSNMPEEENNHPIDMEKFIKDSPVNVYYSDGTLITRTRNSVEFDWIRARIKEFQLEGCYLIDSHNERIEIDKNGYLERWPEDLFSAYSQVLSDLI